MKRALATAAALAARLRESTAAGTLERLTGDDPRQRVRRALREAKSLIETGEILRADAPPHHASHTGREAGGPRDPARGRGGTAVKALCWEGVNRLRVEDVPEPRIRNDQDVIVKVTAGTTCGSDLHLIGGYIPAMRGCGRCWYCANDLRSLCDNSNTNPGITQAMFPERLAKSTSTTRSNTSSGCRPTGRPPSARRSTPCAAPRCTGSATSPCCWIASPREN
ncbi:hypothetical protein [Actinomadura madurae]|uniref:hypothetical protein n=1 Tax=Actinomadura madurae TaxID=1993 RepID=UPI000D8526B7|nr:hypothetical protein [Actinomadura madurae]SPT49421.1 Uncharacterised protein [Actinomadura madurae]